MWDIIGELWLQILIVVFPISCLCVLTCIAWKLLVIWERSVYWTTVLLLETFLEWFRVTWEIKRESCHPRHRSVSLWYNTVCINCKSINTSLLVHNYTWQQNSHTSWLQSTNQTTALLLKVHRSIRAKLASYTTRCSVFSIQLGVKTVL